MTRRNHATGGFRWLVEEDIGFIPCLIPFSHLATSALELIPSALSQPCFGWEGSSRPGLFATFAGKIGDPLKKESFTTRGSINFPPKVAKRPPL